MHRDAGTRAGVVLGVTSRECGLGRVQSQPTLGTQTQAGASRGPWDNCSSQPSLISGILAGSQLSAMQSHGSGDKGLRKRCTMPPCTMSPCTMSPCWRLAGQPLPGGQGRGTDGVPRPRLPPPLSPPLCCSISPALLPPSVPLKLSSLLHPPAPLARRQQWAARWGPGGHGVGAAPRAGSAARPAAARSPSHPGTEGSPVPTSSSAAAASGSTRPAGWPKVMWVPRGCPPPSGITVLRCCRPRCLSQGDFNHPCASSGCSSARGGQDIT